MLFISNSKIPYWSKEEAAIAAVGGAEVRAALVD